MLQTATRKIGLLKQIFFNIHGKISCLSQSFLLRAFYIVKAHYGCEADIGWLSVGDSKDCNWEIRMPDGIKIVYSKLKTCAVYDNTSKLQIFKDARE